MRKTDIKGQRVDSVKIDWFTAVTKTKVYLIFSFIACIYRLWTRWLCFFSPWVVLETELQHFVIFEDMISYPICCPEIT